MKKIIVLLCALVLLAACSSNKKEVIEESPDHIDEKQQTVGQTEPNEEEGEDTAPVKITIPLNQFEDLEEAEIIELLQEEGAIDIQIEKGKSITYEVPKKQFDTTKQQLQKQLNEMIETMQDNTRYPSIHSVKVQPNYTQYDVIVEKGQYESGFDSLAVMSLAMSTVYYFSYIGDTTATTTIRMIDKETEEIFAEQTYPQ